MKIGYSILLGDVVTAEEVGHGDCADFQIVCPCCREAVFKAERRLERGAAHYLSHYATKDPAEAAECENRVARLTREDVARLAGSGRGQALEAFFSRFKEMIADRFEDVDAKFLTRAALRMTGNDIGAFVVRDLLPRHLMRFASAYDAGSPLGTRFWAAEMKVQSHGRPLNEFLSEAVRHVCNGQAASSLALAAAAGALIVVSRLGILRHFQDRGLPLPERLRLHEANLAGMRIVEALPSTSKAAAKVLRAEAQRLKPYFDGQPPDLGSAAADRAALEIADTAGAVLLHVALRYVRPGAEDAKFLVALQKDRFNADWFPPGMATTAPFPFDDAGNRLVE